MAAPLPSPPFLSVAGAFNLRDIGGYPIAGRPGFVVRPRVVLRSADPSYITADGLSTLRGDLGVRRVFDLRSRAEVARAQAHPDLAAMRVACPVFPEKDYGPEAIAVRFSQYASDDGVAGFLRANRAILDNGTDSYRRIFQFLAESAPGEAMLVNCTAGKDRTGVASALVLSLCGVADEVVAHDYGLTEMGLADKKAEFLARLLTMPQFKENPAGAERMLGSKPENMIALLNSLREDYGSVEDFLVKQCGLPAEDVERVRQNLIVEASTLGEVSLPQVPSV